MAHDVFISYVVSDRKTADAVCAVLEKNKIRCWVAPRDVQPGATWAKAVVDAISDSRLMVFILSSQSNDSPQVMREVERAVHRGIPILPLRIEDVVPSGNMEYFLSATHWLDAMSPPLEAHLERLAAAARNLLATGTTNVAPAKPPSRESVKSAPQAQEKATSPRPVESVPPPRSETEGHKSPPSPPEQRQDATASPSRASGPFRVSVLLNKWLDSPDSNFRLQAIEEIDKRGMLEMIDRLAKLVAQDRQWQVRRNALRVLREFKKRKPEAFESWFADLLKRTTAEYPTQTDSFTYDFFKEALDCWGTSEKGFLDLLAHYCESANTNMQYLGVQKILACELTGEVEKLAGLVRSGTDDLVRCNAFNALVMFRKKRPGAFGAWYSDLLEIAVAVPGGGSAKRLREAALKELEELG